jgi:hypothetical protein
MRTHLWLNISGSCLIGFACLVEANVTHRTAVPSPVPSATEAPRFGPGTSLCVRIGDHLSSDIARRGDAWRGITLREITSVDGEAVPAGSAVSGIVDEVRSSHGGRAALGLRAISIVTRSRVAPIRASVDPRDQIEFSLAGTRSSSAPEHSPGAGASDDERTTSAGVTIATAAGRPVVFREGAVVMLRIQ